MESITHTKLIGTDLFDSSGKCEKSEALEKWLGARSAEINGHNAEGVAFLISTSG